jgi:hypothetical protein
VEVPSDRRLFVMCLAAAISAFIIWMLGFQQTGGFSMIIIAVLIFARSDVYSRLSEFYVSRLPERLIQQF